LTAAIAVLFVAAPVASAQTAAPADQPNPGAMTPPPLPPPGVTTGGAAYGEPNPVTTQIVAGMQATLLPNGLAAAPELAPQSVKEAVAAANEIVGKPYQYGGGHTLKFRSRGYDCSGTVSYALHGGSLLDSPLDSSSFLKWGDRGPGSWITVYTNPGHAFAVIAGLRLDTSAASDPSGAKGPRWRPTLRKTTGYKARHPVGL
jgi:cell wall-associated NlpC family hydrolase